MAVKIVPIGDYGTHLENIIPSHNANFDNLNECPGKDVTVVTGICALVLEYLTKVDPKPAFAWVFRR